MRIDYRTTPAGLRHEQADGFFVGWPVRPGPQTLLRALAGSYRCSIAVDVTGDRVVGFATAVSDGVLSASIPLVEVLPGWQRRGIGSELVRGLLQQLQHLYAVDLSCDTELRPFYERFGFVANGAAMIQRRRRNIP